MQQSLRPVVRFAFLFLLGLACFAQSLRTATAAEGDIYFSTPNSQIFRTPDLLDGGLGTDSSIDVFFNIEGPVTSVPADLWAIELAITPLHGATGSVVFNPPPPDGFMPNLQPSSVNPFYDFNLESGGKSTGVLGEVPTLLLASAFFLPPLVDPPAIDEYGNLTLPDGVGLFSVPIHIASGTSGNFIVSFGVRPEYNGVSFSTGPTAAELHPMSQHVAGTLSITEGVPEPTTAILAAIAGVMLLPRRKRQR